MNQSRKRRRPQGQERSLPRKQFKVKEENIKRRKIEIADDSSISSVSIEDFFNVRYPDICANILGRLDARSLVNCRIVSEEWRNVIDKDYNIWIQMVKKYTKICEVDRQERLYNNETWFKSLKNAPVEILQNLALTLWEPKNEKDTNEDDVEMEEDDDDSEEIRNQIRYKKLLKKGLHRPPLQLLAWKGHLETFSYVFDSLGHKNLPDCYMDTPLHFSAEMGHFEICKMILDHSDDKNPENSHGTTPLHNSAENGFHSICQLIIENIGKDYFDQEDEDHQLGSMEMTPLHLAAKNGHLQVCEILIENMKNKNPTNHFDTPYHLAAQHGHLDICQLFINNQDVEDKNPMTKVGTPLHFAASHGHLQICQLIMSKLTNKNPPLSHEGMNYGKTPLHEAAEHGHASVCQYILDNSEDKNPPIGNDYSKTPLHLAALNQHLSVCQLIVANLNEKYPFEKYAKFAKNGTNSVLAMLYRIFRGAIFNIPLCQFLMNHLQNKNPGNPLTGFTAYELAVEKGLFSACELFVKNLGEENKNSKSFQVGFG